MMKQKHIFNAMLFEINISRVNLIDLSQHSISSITEKQTGVNVVGFDPRHLTCFQLLILFSTHMYVYVVQTRHRDGNNEYYSHQPWQTVSNIMNLSTHSISKRIHLS